MRWADEPTEGARRASHSDGFARVRPDRSRTGADPLAPYSQDDNGIKPEHGAVTVAAECGSRAAGSMISELDIWRAANLLVSKHGEGSVTEATRLAGRMRDRGDSEGWQVWARISRSATEF
jgi:hypothetical protein